MFTIWILFSHTTRCYNIFAKCIILYVHWVNRCALREFVQYVVHVTLYNVLVLVQQLILLRTQKPFC